MNWVKSAHFAADNWNRIVGRTSTCTTVSATFWWVSPESVVHWWPWYRSTASQRSVLSSSTSTSGCSVSPWPAPSPWPPRTSRSPVTRKTASTSRFRCVGISVRCANVFDGNAPGEGGESGQLKKTQRPQIWMSQWSDDVKMGCAFWNWISQEPPLHSVLIDPKEQKVTKMKHPIFLFSVKQIN